MSPLLLLSCCLVSAILAAPLQEDGADFADFTNLTLSRGLQDRGLNSCGCAKVPGANRIVGGKEVNPENKLPYQVLVSPCDKKTGHCAMCGGTIVNKRYIITAAHCLYPGPGLPQMTLQDSVFRVMVGKYDHCKHADAGANYLQASAVIKHPDFDINSPDVANDIAILKLSSDLTFTDKIQPACLPSSASKDYSGKASTISGWGGTKANTPDAPVEQPQQCGLKEAIVQVLSPSSQKCTDFLGAESTTQLCAWTSGVDACQGDSGGPLTVPEEGRYVLLGVTSFGSGCASTTPGVYTRVQGFLPWIQETIKDGDC